MKYTICGFSQKAVMNLKKEEVNIVNGKETVHTIKLDCTDLVILRWFVDFFASPGMKKININGETFGWVTYSKAIEDLPIVGGTKKAFKDRMHKMVELGVLKQELMKDSNGTFSWYGFGERYIELIDTDPMVVPTGTEGGTDRYVGGGTNWTLPGVPTGTYKDNSIIDTSIKDIKKERKLSDMPTKSSYDSLIQSKTNNPKLVDAIHEFIKMRKLIKKPMTDHALKLMLNKLDNLSGNNDAVKCAILEQSIANSWQGIFELKDFTLVNNDSCTIQGDDPDEETAAMKAIRRPKGHTDF